METAYKVTVDYFLRYSASFPSDEEYLHSPFDRHCPCRPEVEFDAANSWLRIWHKQLNKQAPGYARTTGEI